VLSGGCPMKAVQRYAQLCSLPGRIGPVAGKAICLMSYLPSTCGSRTEPEHMLCEPGVLSQHLRDATCAGISRHLVMEARAPAHLLPCRLPCVRHYGSCTCLTRWTLTGASRPQARPWLRCPWSLHWHAHCWKHTSWGEVISYSNSATLDMCWCGVCIALVDLASVEGVGESSCCFGEECRLAAQLYCCEE
jgi:hypothetical protein